MKDGWMRGIAVGAMVGVSAVTVASMMNQRTRKQMVKLVTDAAGKVADKATQVIK